MNGKDMLEAMGFVDEAYIQAAASPSRHRRRYWPGVAAAACAVLVVGLAISRQSSREEITLSASQAEDSAAYGAESAEEISLGSALTSGSTAPLEMTVRVVEQSGQTLRCVVEEPGTGGYTVGQEITVVLDSTDSNSSALSRSSENEAAPYSEDAVDNTEDTTEEIAAEETLWIQYTPGEDESTVTAINWSLVSENENS